MAVTPLMDASLYYHHVNGGEELGLHQRQPLPIYKVPKNIKFLELILCIPITLC